MTRRRRREAHRHLLHRARDAAAHARVRVAQVGVNQGVHARELERREVTEGEGLKADQPDGSARADRMAKRAMMRP